MKPILSINHLQKSFLTGFTQSTSHNVLRDVSFTIYQGEIYWFLGINGAGKTTTLENIMWFLTPDSWSVEFFDHKTLSNEVRKKIGYALDKTPYFEFLSWRENVMTLATYAGVDKLQAQTLAQQLFKQLWLEYAMSYRVQDYSQGMKQRLWLILSLINDPDLLFWDEPMSGLDPLGRIVVKNLMKELQAQWKTIIFSTHILSDVQEIADRFWILAWGEIVYEGNIKDITTDLEQFFRDKIAEVRDLEDIRIQ